MGICCFGPLDILAVIEKGRGYDELLKDTLKSLVDAGRNERDSFRFNRFRLVLAADNPGMFKQHIYDVLDSLERDERIHVHVVHIAEIKKLRAKHKTVKRKK